MMARRLTYPPVAQALVESVNALASSAGITVPAAGDGSWSIRPRLPTAPYERRLTLGLRIGGGTHRAHLDAAAVDVVLGDLAGTVSFDTLDGDLQVAVLEEALAEPLAAMARSLSAEVVLDGRPSAAADTGSPPPSPGEVQIDVHDPGGRTRCAVLLELGSPLPSATLETLAASAGRRDCADVPIPVTFELGQAEISGVDLRSLAPGDIVLFDRCYLVENQMRVDFGGGITRLGTIAGSDLSIGTTPGSG